MAVFHVSMTNQKEAIENVCYQNEEQEKKRKKNRNTQITSIIFCSAVI